MPADAKLTLKAKLHAPQTMLIPETSSPVAELTLDANPAALLKISILFLYLLLMSLEEELMETKQF